MGHLFDPSRRPNLLGTCINDDARRVGQVIQRVRRVLRSTRSREHATGGANAWPGRDADDAVSEFREEGLSRCGPAGGLAQLRHPTDRPMGRAGPVRRAALASGLRGPMGPHLSGSVTEQGRRQGRNSDTAAARIRATRAAPPIYRNDFYPGREPTNLALSATPKRILAGGPRERLEKS